MNIKKLVDPMVVLILILCTVATMCGPIILLEKNYRLTETITAQKKQIEELKAAAACGTRN